jgi:Holliday junction resolvase
MPNPRYNKGVEFERKVVDLFRSVGCYAVRSAGSHGVADVVAIKTQKETVYFIQCKSNGKLSPSEWNELVMEAFVYGAVPIVASKHPAGGIKLEWLTDRTKPRGEKAKVEIALEHQDSGHDERTECRYPAELLEVYSPGSEATLR